MTSFRHYRLMDGDKISPMGGATVAYSDDGNYVIAAAAFCNPKDNFNYRYGRHKASGRLTQLVQRKELADDNTYFILPTAEGLAVIDDFMVVMGYTQRGPRQ